MHRVDETWHRLRDWTSGQAPSERLAAQLLLAEGFSDVDPAHPLGGKDGGGDADARRDGLEWILAVYFPRGQQSFKEIRKKFVADIQTPRAKARPAFVFVTNQELKRNERRQLHEKAGSKTVKLMHLEVIAALLDQPSMSSVREQFLGLLSPVQTVQTGAEKAVAPWMQRLEGLQTGGATFCWVMLAYFDLNLNIAKNFAVVKDGEYPLYDVRLRCVDLLTGKTAMPDTAWGEINAPADYLHVEWKLEERHYYRFFFHARNGSWHQDLQMRRSPPDSCWLAATRVMRGPQNEVIHESTDSAWVERFGGLTWMQ